MKLFRKIYDVKRPKSRRADEEFKGKKSLVMCPKCNIVYYQKSWHHNLENFKSLEKDKDFKIDFELCPACKMIGNHQYEGRVKIYKVSTQHEKNLGRLIVNYCQRAYEKDPLDRLITIKKEGGYWEATTTENELASKLAHKIKEVFKRVNVSVTFGKEPSDVAEAVAEFI